jgi:acetoacetyl-CoA synthetase
MTEQPIWRPSADRVASSNLTAFIAEINRHYGKSITDYAALHAFSTTEPERFWAATWDFCDVMAEHRGETIVVNAGSMNGAKWFPEARLNLARNLLRRNDDAPGVIALQEGGGRRSLTFRELRDIVSQYVQAMRGAGIGVGDRVAGFMPNVPEAVAALLATISVGAVWACCSPELGVGAAVDRLIQIGPKLLFAGDGYRYAGKSHEVLGKVADIVARIPSIATTVVVPTLESARSIGQIRSAVLVDEFVSSYPPGDIRFESLPFEHPAFILFSSGTTGAPKCILHSAGGAVLEQLKAQVLHLDVRPGDRYFCWTPTGWVTWNLHLFTLGRGASIVIYDGSPFYPEKDAILRYTADEQVTLVRLTPKYVEELAKAGLNPSQRFDLSSLRTIMCNGSPFTREGYQYVYDKVKRDVHLTSPAGGTDPFGSLVSCNSNAPVWAGEIQVPALGIKVEIFDDSGRPVIEQPGELVVTKPFPSMPIGFLGDPNRIAYQKAYFDMFPDVWRQGDWAATTKNGGFVIYGRSDTTLNARGLRIGTAEIYRQLGGIADIVESAAVGQEWENDTRIVLFVQLTPGAKLDQELDLKIRREIRENLSPRYVPAKIIAVPAIPLTLTGKVSEAAVTNAIHGRPVRNRDSLSNPDALLHFSPELLPALGEQ